MAVAVGETTLDEEVRDMVEEEVTSVEDDEGTSVEDDEGTREEEEDEVTGGVLVAVPMAEVEVVDVVVRTGGVDSMTVGSLSGHSPGGVVQVIRPK